MAALHRQGWCAATGLLVPLLTLAAPGFLRLDGVPPAWAVLWLLPWALVDGPVSGAGAGLALALVLDGLHLGPVTLVPALVVLGWWWGRLGRRGTRIERSFSLGLLALLGTRCCRAARCWPSSPGWGRPADPCCARCWPRAC